MEHLQASIIACIATKYGEVQYHSLKGMVRGERMCYLDHGDTLNNLTSMPRWWIDERFRFMASSWNAIG
tara:strand:- start:450 stop:656 length:207 start_codon:yes stop_codon:yes gene_type:complete